MKPLDIRLKLPFRWRVAFAWVGGNQWGYTRGNTGGFYSNFGPFLFDVYRWLHDDV